jgi:hypothetical protein
MQMRMHVKTRAGHSVACRHQLIVQRVRFRVWVKLGYQRLVVVGEGVVEEAGAYL